jgi:transposase
MRSYSVDLRERIVAGRARGQCAAELARLFGVSKRSVERYWRRRRQTGSVAPSRRGGYRRSRLAGHDARLRAWIAAEPGLTLAELQARLRRTLRLRLGITALWHRLERLGLSYKKNAARRRAGPARRPGRPAALAAVLPGVGGGAPGFPG